MSGMHEAAKDMEIRALRALLVRWFETYGGSTQGPRRKPVDAAWDAETTKMLGTKP